MAQSLLDRMAEGVRPNMKAALTIWGNRISPVFDSANTLLIVEIKDREICSRRYEPFYPDFPSRLAGRLTDLGVGVLICGAISEMPAAVIESAGVKLIPFITGSTDEVLDAYARGISFVDSFLMPGCGFRNRKHAGRGSKQQGCFGQIQGVNCMPKGDKTGPQGLGPGTGKGRGGCKTGSGGQDFGQGQGRGKSGGRGRGKRGGQGRGQRSGQQ